MLLAATDIDVSAGGLVVGILLGALVFIVVKIVLDHVEPVRPYAAVIAFVLALIVFLAFGFDIHSTA